MKAFYLLIAGILLLSACSLRNHKKDNKASISFGSSGGFTGATEEFILRSNGVLSKVGYAAKDTVIIKTVSKAISKDLFHAVGTKNLKMLDLNQVGNMTYFVTLLNDNKIARSYHWTDGSDVPEELKSLYQHLMAQTK